MISKELANIEIARLIRDGYTKGKIETEYYSLDWALTSTIKEKNETEEVSYEHNY